MRKKLILIILIITTLTLNSQELRKVENKAFKTGEKITYVVYFDSFITGKIFAAYATFMISPKIEYINGRPCYHAILSGKTFKKWDWAIYVDDRFDTYIDTIALVPWVFVRKAHEGKFKADQQINIDQFKHQAQFIDKRKNTNKVYPIDPYMHDMISAAYWGRNLDFSKMRPGSIFKVKYVFEDSVYTSNVAFGGRETIKINEGKFDCYYVMPEVQVGNVFKDPYPMKVYFTADDNQIPIYATCKIRIGNVRFELYSYENLRNPMKSKIN
ncbi:MAG: DUF3108 domain-containing protein [Bacteroidales bacterium]|nr:DUF3108 domain-containing protein [Bacteroidales bacterium]MDI9575285.1 DUF3108 domain-containing protein [Bacteroidota bacterium]MDD2593674.1 DUF3108 domain-containing protein [Bacteroidales bacterium]MDD3755371.1 DUF3108 domain-containing protein [Bacteroidales bacterium]MDY0400645.1 DUF3108 domain-containing protein [Bacteroidales bacterium]